MACLVLPLPEDTFSADSSLGGGTCTAGVSPASLSLTY